MHAAQRPTPELRAPSGWVQTNRPAISKGEKVCIAARSLFLWNRLPLEVVYARNERTRLPQQLRGFTVNRQLSAADAAASTHSALGTHWSMPCVWLAMRLQTTSIIVVRHAVCAQADSGWHARCRPC